MQGWQEKAFLIILFGSLVDIMQFIWLSSRWYRKIKRTVYNKIRREVLDQMKGECGCDALVLFALIGFSIIGVYKCFVYLSTSF